MLLALCWKMPVSYYLFRNHHKRSSHWVWCSGTSVWSQACIFLCHLNIDLLRLLGIRLHGVKIKLRSGMQVGQDFRSSPRQENVDQEFIQAASFFPAGWTATSGTKHHHGNQRNQRTAQGCKIFFPFSLWGRVSHKPVPGEKKMWNMGDCIFCVRTLFKLLHQASI